MALSSLVFRFRFIELPALCGVQKSGGCSDSRPLLLLAVIVARTVWCAEEWWFSCSPLSLPALCGVRKSDGSPVRVDSLIVRSFQLALWGVQGVIVVIWLDFM